MYERYTDRARRVIVLAQDGARHLNHNYIGTEHVLLGIVHEGEGVASRVLESLGLQLESIREQVEEIVGQGEVKPSGYIPFTPRAKKAQEHALREALKLGHNYIGTEHLLLGLIREGEGVAFQVLQKCGVTLEQVRTGVIQVLADGVSPAMKDSDASSAQANMPRLGKSAERILKRARREATANGDPEVEWQHIFMATCALYSNYFKTLLD